MDYEKWEQIARESSAELWAIRKLLPLPFLGLHVEETLFVFYRPFWTGRVCDKGVQKKPDKAASGDSSWVRLSATISKSQVSSGAAICCWVYLCCIFSPLLWKLVLCGKLGSHNAYHVSVQLVLFYFTMQTMILSFHKVQNWFPV